MEQSIFNLNSRSWLSKIFSVKYFVSRKGIAPYGFVKETKKAGQKNVPFIKMRMHCRWLTRMTIIFL